MGWPEFSGRPRPGRTHITVCISADRAASSSPTTSETNTIFAGGKSSSAPDTTVTFRLSFGAYGGVKISTDELGKITCGGTLKK